MSSPSWLGYKQSLSFWGTDGVRVDSLAEMGTDVATVGAWRRRAATVTVADGSQRRCVYHQLSAEQGDAQQRTALEREVAAAMLIARSFDGTVWERSFTSLIGYNTVAREPFVIYAAADAPALAGLNALAIREQNAVAAALVRLVRLLEAVGIAHRGIDPHTTTWDGATVTLGRPSAADRIGRRRRPSGLGPWASPEQRAGSGRVDARDDLWSVGRILYRLDTGQDGPADRAPHDLERRGQLSGPLSRLFEVRAEHRPGTAELLRALRVSDPVDEYRRPFDPLDEGRKAYDDLVAQRLGGRSGGHRAHRPGGTPPTGTPIPPRPADPPAADPPTQGTGLFKWMRRDG
ncbi:hypothetical protein [Yinghuangia seranimata]|uniref:hypothetical protein n=1 Tax=Yinghuangia seranimata TaxID=408067 RepID=UPI00248B5325|nr:hypothetical protein [Yinghuangia seranimata]MDI2130367.1 hypothetical protein [Yinghuangia seranimata]